MSSFFKVDTGLVAAADSQEMGFKPLESKVYNAQIVAAYIVDSSRSDARALTIQYKVEGSERVMYESLWYQEGRGLNTYNKAGQEILLPSFTNMLDFFAAAGVDIETVAPKELKVKHFGTEGMYPVFEEFTGKAMELGVRETLVDDYKEPSESVGDNEIAIYVSKDGKTGGEIRGAKNAYSVEAFNKMIAKKPVKDGRKLSKGGASAPAAGGSEAPVQVATW